MPAKSVSPTFSITSCGRGFSRSPRSTEGIRHDAEIVAVGTLLHDVTLNDSLRRTSPVRGGSSRPGEVIRFRSGHNDQRAALIWDCVALNSTPSIGLYKQAEVALCTTGVGLDVVGFQFDQIPASEISGHRCRIPEAADEATVSSVALPTSRRRTPKRATTILYEIRGALCSGLRSPSAVDWVMNAPFEE